MRTLISAVPEANHYRRQWFHNFLIIGGLRFTNFVLNFVLGWCHVSTSRPCTWFAKIKCECPHRYEIDCTTTLTRDLSNASSSDAINEASTEPSTSVKLKKYTFTKEAILSLLKSVREFDAHLAGHGDKDSIWESLRIVHIYCTCQLADSTPKTNCKDARDKLRSLLTSWKSKNRENLSASGISEYITEEE